MTITPIEFYHQILESLDFQADSQGAIHYKNLDGELSSQTVDGRQLVLPTPDVLRVISTDNTMIAFHPLSENITMGESLIIRRLKLWTANKLTNMMAVLGISLLEIASEKGPLTAETTELGKALANATPKTLEHFLNVIDTIDQTSKQFVSIYIRRKGNLPDREQPYRRVAVVRFPIMDEFQAGKPENMIFDVKMSKKDKVTIGELFKFMLKRITIDGAYSVGTDSSSAPNFVALMKAFAVVATELSSHALAMKSKINDPSLLPKITWLEQLDDLASFTGVIPPLKDNEGESETANLNVATQSTHSTPVQPSVQTVATNGVPMMQQPVVGRYQTTNTVQQPVVQQQMQPQMMQQQYPMTPQPGAPVPLPGYGQMGGFYQQPQMMQQQQQPDFNSLVTQTAIANTMPQMQMMQQQMQPQMMQPQMMMQQPMLPQQGIPPMMPGLMPGMMPQMMMPGMMPQMQPQMMMQQPMPMSYSPGAGTGKYTTM